MAVFELSQLSHKKENLSSPFNKLLQKLIDEI